jgi:hypothetical protein
MMKHFTNVEWADLARGVAITERAAQMRTHLEEGCAECAEISKQMAKIEAMSKRERSYEPPTEAIRVAKSLMSAQRVAESSAAAPQFLKLVFDSITQPLLAGVRGAAAGRQLLYQKENCCIDIRLESQAGRQIEMVGQVLDSGAIGRGLDQIPVSLQKGDQIFARTLTNHFGEFRFVLDDTDQVQMVVDVTVDRRLVVPLPS